MRRKAVPWSTEDCSKAVKTRNKAFRILKNTHNFQHLIQYKKKRRSLLGQLGGQKRACWQSFCDKIGGTTPVGDVWGMGESRREWDYPVMKGNDETAVSGKDKAEMMVK